MRRLATAILLGAFLWGATLAWRSVRAPVLWQSAPIAFDGAWTMALPDGQPTADQELRLRLRFVTRPGLPDVGPPVNVECAGEDEQADGATAALLHTRRTPRQLELLYRLPDREPPPGTHAIRFTLPRSSPFQRGTAVLELVERIPNPPPWQLAVVAFLFASSVAVFAITRTRSPAARR